MKKLLMFPVFHLLLKPLIKRNYRLRKAGKAHDTWYWADALAFKYGYTVPNRDDKAETLDRLIILNNGKWQRITSGWFDAENIAMLEVDVVKMRVFVRSRDFIYSIDEWNSRVAKLGFEIQKF